MGRVLTRKSFMRLSITRWCREAFDSHGATWLPLQRGLRARAQQLGFRGERPVSIGWAVCHDTPNFGATAWHAAYIERFSARMRSSTRRTTRSFASWSNFFGIFQIFPSTQTEQNLGHFSSRTPQSILMGPSAAFGSRSGTLRLATQSAASDRKT